MNSGEQSRLSLLDGLRGLAAIAVMLYHMGNVFSDSGLFSRCYLFVDFFFLLSGFVLTLSAEEKMNAGLGTAGFMRARIRRLWPTIAMGTLIGALCYGPFDGWTNAPAFVLLGLLIIPAVWSNGQLFPLNGPQWSLFLELLANLAHSLVLRRLGNTGLQLVIAIAAGALSAVIITFGSNTIGPFAFNWWHALPRMAFAYSLGIWIGRKWMAHPHKQIVPWQVAFALPGLAVIILAALPFNIALGDTLTTIFLLPALFWLAATSALPDNARPWLNRLGKLSFPIYATHLPIIQFFARFGDSWSLRIAAISTAIGVAHILAMTLESRVARDKTLPNPLHGLPVA